jgi:hypothetical protein
MSIIEFHQILGFIPKRMFTIQDVPVNGMRGDHAHKKCLQALHCLIGKVEVQVESKREKASVMLDSPSRILLIPANNWVRLHFLQETSILNVYASDLFEEFDYIRSYDEFTRVELE